MGFDFVGFRGFVGVIFVRLFFLVSVVRRIIVFRYGFLKICCLFEYEFIDGFVFYLLLFFE